MAVPPLGSWPWQAQQKHKKQFLDDLALHNKTLAQKRSNLLHASGGGKGKMSAGTIFGGGSGGVGGNPYANASTGAGWLAYVTGTTSTVTATQQHYIQSQINALQQQAQAIQMQQMQNAGLGSGMSGAMGICNPPNQYPTPPPSAYSIPEDHAVSAARGYGHVVLKKMRRMVHTKLMYAHGGVARVCFDAMPVAPLMVREIDGYALPPERGEYIMPDGSVLLIDDYGNYRVEDHEAKVTYKANRTREWNPYISASDLLESFVTEIGKHPLVNQGNVLRLPVEAFINWLINKAAEKDGDSLVGLPKVEDALKALPAPAAQAA